MAARIIVQSGISAGTSYWIERNVVRVGSEPGSDMIIPCPSVAPHALTVEFRQTEYRVYNRSSEPIVIGGRLLQAGQHIIWADSDLLQLKDDITLALELASDPSPAPRPAVAPQVPVSPLQATAKGADNSEMPPGAQGRKTLTATSTLTADASPGISKTTLQWAITAFCVLGCILLLARQQFRSPTDARGPAPELETVISLSHKSGSQSVSKLVDRLQLAEAAYIRGQTAIARERFLEIHDALKTLSREEDPWLPDGKLDAAPPTSPSDALQSPTTVATAAQMMGQFVEHRLRHIGG